MKKYLIALLILTAASVCVGREVGLTVFNNDRALVHDIRKIEFQKGIFTYDFTNIPWQIEPTSVRFHADKAAILEQNYEFDIVSADKIREKFIGEKIRLFFEDGSMQEGLLQPSGVGGLIIIDEQGGVKIVRTDKLMHYDFPHMPEDFVERPTLVWLLNSTAAGVRKAEVSYLTRGMNWHAEYVSLIEEKALSFTGWVSIDNRSGETFEEAKLKLIAGDVHMIDKKRVRRAMAQAADIYGAQGDEQFKEKSFFEYHLYTLQRRTTVKNNQIKQISLFPEAKVKYNKTYIYDIRYNASKIGVYLVFQNSKDSGLGMALPAGKVMVYQRDEDGSQEFIGEDLIDHTPRDEEVKILMGNAFDLVGERKMLESRQLSRYDREQDIQISLRNHKDTAVEIVVREHLYGYWTIFNNSHDYEKVDANTVEFKVKVPPHKPKEELLVKFTVRYSRL
ncbi:MAG: DUF4139 domain-containing protein [candidate division Zixibacteria bacterium]|nr:DUF4139 domain-containing protein [Candidatus Tariuqbacter arcticus]